MMKRLSLFLAMAATVLLAGCFGSQPMPGGYAKASVKDPAVLSAAEFAVKAARQEMPGILTATLKLDRVLAAQQQVVAGMNYRLKLRVITNSGPREVEAVVFEPIGCDEMRPASKLTSWKWL
ncbi:MAG: hypothetical protein RLZZ476_2680 [Verrucomicrobiota bacterium]|jgi:negative regulator of sigma E activity